MWLISQHFFLPGLILAELILGIFIILSTVYLQKPKISAIIAITLNLVLFQFSLSLFSILDYYNNQNFQLGCFNFFSNTFLSVTQTQIFDELTFGLDSLALIFTTLTIYLINYSLIIGANTRKFGSLKFFIILLFIIQLMLCITFYTTNLFIFYVGFEGLTLPTFFLIFLFGAEKTKIRAAKLFLVYSFTSSTLLSWAISLLYWEFQTTSLNQILFRINLTCIDATFTSERYLFLFILLFIAFGVKVPIAPFHMWLPEAHAEASTAGSVILAGLILKLGGYGIVRYLLPLYSTFTEFNPYIHATGLISILFVSYSCFRTTNLKQIIAYTSIIHMNTTLISLFSEQTLAVAGGILSMCSHSLIASGLFICAGILYNRTGTYELQYYGGLVHTMPLFSFLFLGLILANVALPFTLGFLSEFIMLTSLVTVNIYITILLVCFLSSNGMFFLWIANRLVYNDITAQYNPLTPSLLGNLVDVNVEETVTLSSLLLTATWLGFMPNSLTYFILWAL